jgi:hypothetical protein
MASGATTEMKSETRANWIFLGIFLLVMGPGLAMLTIKAYKRGAAGMNPPAPKTVATYNNPNPQNPAMPRVVPPETANFVETILFRIQKVQPELARRKNADGKPIVSERLSLECIALGTSGQAGKIALVGWDRNFAPLPSLYEFTGERGGETFPLKMSAYEQLNLPLEVRDELQTYGYIRPPDSVMWIVLDVPGTVPLDALDLKYEIDGKTTKDRLYLGRIDAPTTQPGG